MKVKSEIKVSFRGELCLINNNNFMRILNKHFVYKGWYIPAGTTLWKDRGHWWYRNKSNTRIRIPMGIFNIIKKEEIIEKS